MSVRFLVVLSLLSLPSLESLSQTSLPRYRDEGLAPATYAYKVSALSRFYTAGNSTPTETESVASEPVAVTVGGVRFFWNDVVCKVGETASVMLSIENALNYNVAGRVQVVSYDPIYLEPAELGEKTGVKDVTVGNPLTTVNGMVRVFGTGAAVTRLENAQTIVADTALTSLALKDGDALQASDNQTAIRSAAGASSTTGGRQGVTRYGDCGFAAEQIPRRPSVE